MIFNGMRSESGWSVENFKVRVAGISRFSLDHPQVPAFGLALGGGYRYDSG
jgi:hypothetical protein